MKKINVAFYEWQGSSQRQLKQRGSSIVKNLTICADVPKMVLQNQCPSLKEVIPHLLIGPVNS